MMTSHQSKPEISDDGTSVRQYRGYEMFTDPSHYHKVACRQIGEKDFNKTAHFDDFDDAEQWVDKLLDNGSRRN